MYCLSYVLIGPYFLAIKVEILLDSPAFYLSDFKQQRWSGRYCVIYNQ